MLHRFSKLGINTKFSHWLKYFLCEIHVTSYEIHNILKVKIALLLHEFYIHIQSYSNQFLARDISQYRVGISTLPVRSIWNGYFNRDTSVTSGWVPREGNEHIVGHVRIINRVHILLLLIQTLLSNRSDYMKLKMRDLFSSPAKTSSQTDCYWRCLKQGKLPSLTADWRQFSLLH